MRPIQRHRAIRGIPLFLSIAGLFMTLGVSGCGQGISPAQGVSPAQCVSPAINLPHAVAAAVRTGDGSVLVPYLASREDYVIFSPGQSVDDPDGEAVALEISSAEQAMVLMQRCRDLGRKCGMVMEDITLNKTLVRGPGLMVPYDERLLTGERLDGIADVADTPPSRCPGGIPADARIDIELESHGHSMSIVLGVRRTPQGPKVIAFEGCAALTIQQLRSVMDRSWGVSPEEDAAILALVTKGMVSEAFPYLKGRELYSAPRTWVLLPTRCDPKDKDRVDIGFESPALSMLGLPTSPRATAEGLIETAADSCTFVSDVLLGATTLAMTPRVVPVAMAGRTSVPDIKVNGIQRHFRVAGMGGRLLVAPREKVTEMLPSYRGHCGCNIRYEDGLAAEVIWIAPEADGAPTSSSTTAAEESK